MQLDYIRRCASKMHRERSVGIHCSGYEQYTFFLGHVTSAPPSPISFIGCSTPISLLTVMMDTRDVSGRMALSRSWRSRGRDQRAHTNTTVQQQAVRVLWLGGEGGALHLKTDNPVLLYWEVGDLHSLILHRTTRVQHTLVLLHRIGLPRSVPIHGTTKLGTSTLYHCISDSSTYQSL